MHSGVIKAALVGALSAGVGALVVVASAPWADAKATYESPYGYQRTWNAALRLVRVDNGWKVTEKDETSGYLLFEYKSVENAKPTAGSVEFVRGGDESAPVSVLIELPQMPHYHEQLMLDALASKMRKEYGDAPPPRRAPPSPPSESPDAGPDEGT
jgi:hypothetical protein